MRMLLAIALSLWLIPLLHGSAGAESPSAAKSPGAGELRMRLMMMQSAPLDRNLRLDVLDMIRVTLDSGAPDSRVVALEGLASYTPRQVGLLPVLQNLLEDQDAGVRAAAARALGLHGLHAKGAVARLTKRLADPDPEVRREAAVSLATIQPTESCVPVLVGVLKSGEKRQVTRAATALGRLGSRGRSALPDLVGVLGQDGLWAEPELARRPIAAALASMGTSAVPALAEALGSIDESVAIGAAVALSAIGDTSALTMGALHRLLEQGPDLSALHAAIALATLGDRSAAVRARLLEDFGEKRIVIDALAGYGKSIVPKIGERMEVARAGGIVLGKSDGAHARWRVVVAGLNVFERIGPDAVETSALARGFAVGDDAVLRRHAIATLVSVDPGSDASRAILVDRLGDPDDVVRLRVAGALARTHAGVQPALPVLLQALRAEADGDRRARAAEYLALLAVPDSGAHRALEDALSDVDARVRLNSAAALWQQATTANVVVPVLTGLVVPELPLIQEYVDEGTPRVSVVPRAPALQAGAARLLGDIGFRATSATDALRFASKDANAELRAEAENALEKILSAVIPSSAQ